MTRDYEDRVPVLYRQTEDGPTEPCPYCKRPHFHGAGDGHRVAHCSAPRVDASKGYIVRTRRNGP
jgi:hypothetical protein